LVHAKRNKTAWYAGCRSNVCWFHKMAFSQGENLFRFDSVAFFWIQILPHIRMHLFPARLKFSRITLPADLKFLDREDTLPWNKEKEETGFGLKLLWIPACIKINRFFPNYLDSTAQQKGFIRIFNLWWTGRFWMQCFRFCLKLIEK